VLLGLIGSGLYVLLSLIDSSSVIWLSELKEKIEVNRLFRSGNRFRTENIGSVTWIMVSIISLQFSIIS
jgi:hypothetical protein